MSRTPRVPIKHGAGPINHLGTSNPLNEYRLAPLRDIYSIRFGNTPHEMGNGRVRGPLITDLPQTPSGYPCAFSLSRFCRLRDAQAYSLATRSGVFGGHSLILAPVSYHPSPLDTVAIMLFLSAASRGSSRLLGLRYGTSLNTMFD
jgi:hypothetical protein